MAQAGHGSVAIPAKLALATRLLEAQPAAATSTATWFFHLNIFTEIMALMIPLNVFQINVLANKANEGSLSLPERLVL